MTEVWRIRFEDDTQIGVYRSWTDWGLRAAYEPHPSEATVIVQVGPFALMWWWRRDLTTGRRANRRG